MTQVGLFLTKSTFVSLANQPPKLDRLFGLDELKLNCKAGRKATPEILKITNFVKATVKYYKIQQS